MFQENKKRQVKYMCISGGKKCSFFRKFDGLYFLETSVLRFARLPYYRRIYVCSDSVCFIFVLMLPFASDWKKSSKSLNLFSVAQVRQLHLILRSNWLSTCSAVLQVLHHNSATTTRWIEMFYQLTYFYCLTAFNSWDIR